MIAFLRALGAGSHIVAVCQPCVAVLAAAALMAEDGDEAQPRSMTLMAGPIVRVSARRKSTNWPPNGRLAGSSIGAGRWVYPGFLQLAAFIGMNLERHLRSFGDMAEARATNDMTKLEVLQSFYEEYFAVMDLPAEFYLA